MTRTSLVADIGKSTTRVATCRDGILTETVLGPGIVGLAAAQGVADVVARLDELIPQLGVTTTESIAIGVAGAINAARAAGELAETVAARWNAPACVTSDVVTAHLGALGGRAGTLLVAGTGAVALGVFDDGSSRLADGLGPELGDHGSGYWIGRAGVRAALRTQNVSGTETELTRRWNELTSHSDPISWLSAQDSHVAAIARFAPLVLDAAKQGDRTALEIVDDAIDALTATVCAASDVGASVAALGGLTLHKGFRARLDAAIRAADRRPHNPLGSAMTGAALAADRTDLPHERLIHRAG